MRTILFPLLISLNLIFSCSNEETTIGEKEIKKEIIEEDKSPELPDNIKFPIQSAKIGELLTIHGTFFVNETYTITFKNNAIGEITEITSDFITVKVPKNAESGAIKLTLNNESLIIGSIKINLDTPKKGIYIMHNASNRLAKIDIEDGSLTFIGKNIRHGKNTRGAVIHKKNNEYIGLDMFEKPSLVRVNLMTGEHQNVILKEDGGFRDITIDNEDSIYVMHTSSKRLAKINIEDGGLTFIGENIQHGKNTRGAVIHNKNNEYIGLDMIDKPTLVRINLKTGKHQNIILKEDGGFKDLTIDSKDNIYVMHTNSKRLAKINIEDGSLTFIGEGIPYGRNVRGAVIHEDNNEYIGLDLVDKPTLVRINLETGKFQNIILGKDGGYRDLTIN